MASNSFGNQLRYTTWGESHGSHIGCVVDGFPAGIALSHSDIQPFLDKRRPGFSNYASARKEKDQVSILSGIFEGKSTGAPISMIIANADHKTSDYDQVKSTFRPGHGDYTYFLKYGNNNDYRGGGRSSARETAMRVAAGALAMKLIPGIKIKGCVAQIGPYKANTDAIETAGPENLYCPDQSVLNTWQEYISAIKEQGDSVGSIVEVRAENVPPGLGEPIYNKLSGGLALAMMNINAVKGMEIGTGFKLCELTGSEANDQMITDNEGKISFLSNHSGGITAGISTGQSITIRLVLKPPSSIKTQLKTVDKNYNDTTISTEGRHDPCLGPRCVPVVEAMLAFTLADYYLLSKIYA